MLPLAPLFIGGLTALATAPTGYKLYQDAQQNRVNRQAQLGINNNTAVAPTITAPTLNDFDAYTQLQKTLNSAKAASETQPISVSIPDVTAPADDAETAPIIRDLGNGQTSLSYPSLNTDIAEATALNRRDIANNVPAVNIPEPTIRTKTKPKTSSNSRKNAQSKIDLSSFDSGSSPVRTNNFDWLNDLLPLLAAGGLGYLLAK